MSLHAFQPHVSSISLRLHKFQPHLSTISMVLHAFQPYLSSIIMSLQAFQPHLSSIKPAIIVLSICYDTLVQYSALPQYKRVTSSRVVRSLDLQVWDSANLRF